MKVFKNKSLKSYNTFRVDVNAGLFAVVKGEEEVIGVVKKYKNKKKMVIGDGSNLLLTKDFDGLVIKNEIKGKKILREDKSYIYLEIAGGEDWHAFVEWAVKQNFGGVENLALIPGTVGAAPVQNIAAYGQNFVSVFEGLDAINLKTGQLKKFSKKECKLAYRSSIFKNELRDRFIITKVRIKLTKEPKLEINYFMIGGSYDSIKQELEACAEKPYTIKDVFEAVIRIRKRKLPDEIKEPNVGSFFINPAVRKSKLEKLKRKIKELQYYPMSQLTYLELNNSLFKTEKYVKVSAGRLLDELGWRGKKNGNCWMHEKQALILVTNGKATGKEILNFSKKVKKSIKDAYGIELESEVNIY